MFLQKKMILWYIIDLTDDKIMKIIFKPVTF